MSARGDASTGVVKDDPERRSLARPDRADAVTHVGRVPAANALHRPVRYGEDHGVALADGDHRAARLHARPLLGEQELAALEILAGPGQQDRGLEREAFGAVEILVEAVVVARPVAKQQWRRLRL